MYFTNKLFDQTLDSDYINGIILYAYFDFNYYKKKSTYCKNNLR
jgi:hypothetical protein